MPYQENGWVRIFFHLFDGQSESADQLHPAEWKAWIGFLAFSRLHRPHGWLNDSGSEEKPKGASLNRLARWCGVGKGTVVSALAHCCELEMLKLDRRRDPSCYEIANWGKWQDMENSRSATDHQADQAGQPLTGNGQPATTAGQPLTDSGQPLTGTVDSAERSATDRHPEEIQTPQGLRPKVSEYPSRSAGDFSPDREVEKVRTEGREGTTPAPISSILEDLQGKVTSGEGYEPGPTPLVELSCKLLAPLTKGIPDGAQTTVEGAYASHSRAPEFLVAAATALRARYDEGEQVHLRYLSGNVLDLIGRSERQEQREADREVKREADREGAGTAMIGDGRQLASRPRPALTEEEQAEATKQLEKFREQIKGGQEGQPLGGDDNE